MSAEASRPLILITNDDGIQAKGIQALASAMVQHGDVVVVAPDRAQSGMGHAVTINGILKMEPVTFGVEGVQAAWQTTGTPVDCVKLAIYEILGKKPDLLLSGINHGSNASINVIYSGTVAAAIEAAFLGVPAIAVSLHIGDPARTRYGRAAAIAREIIDRVLEHPIDPHSVINVNVPRTEDPDAPMPPIRLAEMNTAAGSSSFEERSSPDGRTYYWACGSGLAFDRTAAGSDVETLLERYVTVTPLDYNLTDHPRMNTWRERLES